MKEKHKICIWMNVKTHHQSAFFSALFQHPDIDLAVRYFSHYAARHREKGYSDAGLDERYEEELHQNMSPQEMIATVPDVEERIHVIGISFAPQLVSFFIKKNFCWFDWTERGGYSLAGKVSFNIFLFNLLYPLYALVKWKESILLKKANGVFCQGYLARKYLALLRVPDDKIHDLYYAPAGLKKSAVSNINTNPEENGIRFVFVGKLWKCKGIDILLKAFSQLQGKAELILIGPDASNGEYKKIADSSRRKDDITFSGTIANDKIGSCIAACDVLILPSRYDGWGCVLNEGASLGKALIATTQVGAAWHLIRNGENGFRVKAGSVPALREAMQKYLDLPTLAVRHGKESLILFERHFSPEKNVERFLSCIEKIPQNQTSSL